MILFQYIITSFHAVITIERAISAKMSLLVRATFKMACVYQTKYFKLWLYCNEKIDYDKTKELRDSFFLIFWNTSLQILKEKISKYILYKFNEIWM